MAEPLQSAEPGVAGLRLVLGRLADAALLEPSLTAAECRQADRIAHAAVRARHVVSRVLRRRMLSECTGRPGADLRFEGDGEGKPRLAEPGGWDFNTSHAGEFVAVCAARFPVGVDIEEIRSLPEMGRIVSRYFHADEATAWQALPTESREQGFFVLWSAREAAVKCAGLGLGSGMGITRVDPAILHEPATAAQVGGGTIRLHRVDAPHGYVMVVAAGM